MENWHISDIAALSYDVVYDPPAYRSSDVAAVADR